jgi:hypothetical protein
MTEISKHCKRCGADYNQESWELLAWVGEWRLPWGEVQHLRNCACGNTLAIVLEVGEAEPDSAEKRYESVSNSRGPCGPEF